MTSHHIPVDRVGGEDRLGRTSFAELLNTVLRSVDANAGAVVSVAGSWGSGKSWLLDETRRLSSSPGAEPLHWVTFSPWMVSGSQALMETMLVEIARQIEVSPSLTSSMHNAAKVASSVLSFAQTFCKARHLLSPISGFLAPAGSEIGTVVAGTVAALEAADGAAREVSKAISGLKDGEKKTGEITGKGPLTGRSLPEAREEVVKALNLMRGRVVVVIDDLDRTSPKEIAEVLQAVKAVADFPRVVYLLAYDEHVIIRGLESWLKINDGAAYLEKIVQVPLVLPDPSFMKLRELGLGMLRDLKGTLGLRQREDLIERSEIAVSLMRGPRDVARWKTQLYTVLPHVRDVLDVDDVALVLALQQKAPEVVSYLNRYRPYFFDAHHLAHDEVHRRAGLVSPGPQGLQKFNETQQMHIKELRAVIERQGSAADLIDRALKELRIPTEQRQSAGRPEPLRLWKLPNWIRLFNVSKDRHLEDNSDLVAMICHPSAIDKSEHRGSSKSLMRLFGRLMEMLDEPDVLRDTKPNLHGLADVMCEALKKHGETCRNDKDELWPAPYLKRLFEHPMGDKSTQEAILDALVKQDLLLDLSSILLCDSVSPGIEGDDQPGRLSKAMLEPIQAAWLESARRFIERPDAFALSNDEPFAVLTAMVRLGEPASDVRGRIEAAMSDYSATTLKRWLRADTIGAIPLGLWESSWPERPSVMFLRRRFEADEALCKALPHAAHVVLGPRAKETS